MVVDTHCHLDFEQFEEDRDDVIKRALNAGVERIIVPAIDLQGCQRVLELADKYETVFAAVGIHPNSSAGWQSDWIDQVREFAGHQKVVAIGEIGLDYYRDRSPRNTQQNVFQAQLELAAELDLPVIIHNRQSDEDVLRCLKDSPLDKRTFPGVLHSFSTSWATAEEALDSGYLLGFTGPVTYKKADELRSVVKQTPLDRLLIETDAPFLSPQQYRGRRNEPSYVTLVGERIAEIHNISFSEIARKTSRNAEKLFGNRLFNGI